MNYLVHEKKLLALIHSLKVWRQYILEMKFKIQLDHDLLRYLPTQLHLRRRWCRWVELLQEFDFDIEYIKAKENLVADILSRRLFANAIICIKNILMGEIKWHYVIDDFF